MSVHPWQGDRQVSPAGMLASDSARERAVETLKGAYTEGRLTHDEFQSRAGLAYESRTYGELDALVADIPRRRPVPPAFRPAPPPRTNGYAIASLVCGVAGTMTAVTAVPAVVFGHMARRQISRTGEQGDGMAIGGLVLGYLVVAGMAALIGLVVLAMVLGG